MKIEHTKLNSDSFNLEDFKRYLSKAFEGDSSAFKGVLSEMEEIEKLTKEAFCSTNEPANNSSKVTTLTEAQINLIKNLKALAEKDKIPANFININNLKLFMNKQKLSELDEGYRIKLDSLSEQDIEFFKICSENKEITINDINAKGMQANLSTMAENNQISYKSFNFSKGLFNLIEYSFKNNKPVRVDIQGTSSVILKMSSEGKLIAEFITNDKAMEYAIKSSLPGLKDKLDSEGIPYEEINYKESREQNKQKNKNKGGNK